MGRLLLACLLTLLVTLPSPAGAAGPDGRGETGLTVFVSIPPYQYLAARVGGPDVAVETLVPEGQSPSSYEPAPRQMASLARARVYFRAGLPFEDPLLRRLAGAFRDVEVVDLRRGVPLRAFGGEEGSGPGGHPDPHVWLDPARAKIQAGTVCETLCSLDPAREAGYRSRLRGLCSDLDATHRKVAGLLAPARGGKIYVFHPAFGYFTDAYGLIQVPLETEGKEPGPRHLARLMEQARRDGVRVLFVQPQHPDREARALADEVGARLVPLDPLARDYLENLERMAAAIRESFEKSR